MKYAKACEFLPLTILWSLKLVCFYLKVDFTKFSLYDPLFE